MGLNQKVQIHFFADNKILFKSVEYFVPRVGDEIRFREDKFYRVVRAVWAYDEPDCPRARVNIELTKTV